MPKGLLVRCSILGAVVLAACGLSTRQQVAVQTFSAATLDFATVTSAELVKSRTDVIEMSGVRAGLGESLDRARMDGAFTVERVKTRLDALDALESYATLLHTLVTSSQEEELQRASASFVDDMRKVHGVALSDGNAAAIAAAVEQVGGVLVEYMRARAVRAVVNEAHPAVVQVIELVRSEFSPSGGWTAGYGAAMSGLTLAAGKALRRGGARHGLVDQADVLVRRNETRFSAVAEQVGKATGELQKAEAELLESVRSSDVETEDIERFAAQVQEFVTIYAILRDE